jgi:multidrug resistance efflux pump
VFVQCVARLEWESLGGDPGKPNELAVREPQLAQARALLASAKAGLEEAERNLARCEIRAPFAGRVGEKTIDAGQYVTRGTAVARIYAVDFA